MAYLRGNTVVDGNLYVEGDLLVKEIRPDLDGAIITYKDVNQGMIPGRHLISKDISTGSLVDSIFVETIGNDRDSSKFSFAKNNTNLVEFFNITNSSLTLGNYYPVNNIEVEDATLSPNYAAGKSEQPENITSWGY